MEKQERSNAVRNLKKRILALVLVTAMVVGLVPAFALPAHSAPSSLEGREVISFNNAWRFCPGEWPQANEADADDSDWLYVNAPHSTIHYTPENYYHEDLGIFWYRRHFTMDPSMEGKQMILTFEGAMQEATVWLNGEQLGAHQGGYTPFAFNRGQGWYGATAYWDYADYAGFDVDKLTFCGVVDVARIPKFGAYFFQSQTDPNLDMTKYGLDTGAMVYIANTWASDSPDQVRVFSNCDEAALYPDDQLIAKKTPDTQMWAPHGNTDNPTGYPTADSGAYVSTENLEHPPFTFDLSDYTPGEGTLKAAAYLNGEKVATFVRSAPGAASQITLTASCEGLTSASVTSSTQQVPRCPRGATRTRRASGIPRPRLLR